MSKLQITAINDPSAYADQTGPIGAMDSHIDPCSIIWWLHQESIDRLKRGSRRIHVMFRRHEPSKTLSNELLADRALAQRGIEATYEEM